MRVDELISELQDLIADSKTLPLSGGKVIVDAENVLTSISEVFAHSTAGKWSNILHSCCIRG